MLNQRNVGLYNVLVLNFIEKCTEKTDDKFNEGTYKGTHQQDISPLIQYGLCCVKGFPLDYTHLICLGVTRRMDVKFPCERS